MTLTLLAAVPAALLTAMYLYETRSNPLPLRARAAKSTLQNALRGRRAARAMLRAAWLCLGLAPAAGAATFEDALTAQEQAILVAAWQDDKSLMDAYDRDRVLPATEALVRGWRERIAASARRALAAPASDPGLDLLKQDVQGFEKSYFLDRMAEVEPTTGRSGPVGEALAELKVDGVVAIIRRKDPRLAKSLREAVRSLIKADLRAYLAAPGRPPAREAIVEWVSTAVRPGVSVPLAVLTARRILAEKPAAKRLPARIKDLDARNRTIGLAIRRGFDGDARAEEVSASLAEIARLLASIENSQSAVDANLSRCFADARSAGFLAGPEAEKAARAGRDVHVLRSFNLQGMMAPNAYNEMVAGWEGREAAGFPFRVVTTDVEHQRRAAPLNAVIDQALGKVRAGAGSSYPSFSKGCAALR